MSDEFGFLDGLALKGDEVREYTVEEVLLPNEKNPVFYGRHAGETNKPYFNASLRRSARRAKALARGEVNAATVSAARRLDLDLYPQFVITGWRDVCDAKGKELPFTQDRCAALLAKLPSHIFDRVRNFFGDPANFMSDIIVESDVVATGND